MASNKVQLLGGSFQDVEGNPLNHGQVIFQLDNDEQITGGGQVAAGVKVRAGLDSQGDIFGTNTVSINNTSLTSNILTVLANTNVENFVAKGDTVIFPPAMSSSFLSNQSVIVISVLGNSFTAAFPHANYTPVVESGKSYTIGNAVVIWPNDLLNPAGSLYTVVAYTASGQEAWGPFYGAIFTPGPFNLDTWVPSAPPGGGGASSGSILLQTNSVNNVSQLKENLFSGDGSVVLTDTGNGNIDIRSLTVPGGAVLLNPTGNQTISGSFSLTNRGIGQIGVDYSSLDADLQGFCTDPATGAVNFSTQLINATPGAVGVQAIVQSTANIGAGSIPTAMIGICENTNGTNGAVGIFGVAFKNSTSNDNSSGPIGVWARADTNPSVGTTTARGIGVFAEVNNDGLGTTTTLSCFSAGGATNSGLITNLYAYDCTQLLAGAGVTNSAVLHAIDQGTGYVILAAGGKSQLGSLTLIQAAPTVAASQIGFGSTVSTSATAGTHGAAPAQVVGYIIINVAGTQMKIPYYNV